MNKIILIVYILVFAVCFAGCSANGKNSDVSTSTQVNNSLRNEIITETEKNDMMQGSNSLQNETITETEENDMMQGSNSLRNETITETKKNDMTQGAAGMVMPSINAGERASEKSKYTDKNGDVAIIPAEFTVSAKEDEQTINSGLVIIGKDGSEFVWIPTTQTSLAVRDFDSYVSWGANFSDYYDETDLKLYREMVESTELYGGFYMGRYEASYGGGDDLSDYVPASKRILDSSEGRIWVQFSPQDATVACQNLYADNDTVQGFFPWGINYDTTLQWIIDSGCKTEKDVTKDSTSWGNYSNDTFSLLADGSTTGKWKEATANNIYDLAGNNWEWTQERYGSGDYVMRGGGYNLMGGTCRGSDYPAALRDPLPGSDRHPNVVFRVALFVK